MIIKRYLIKEVMATFLITLAILMLVFISRQLVRYLAEMAAGKLSTVWLFKLLLLQIPYFFSWLAPAALFVGTLLSYGKLYSNYEMLALFASGFSQQRLIKITLLIAGALSLLLLMCVFILNPFSESLSERLLTQAKSASFVDFMQPGRFREAASGKKIYYAEQISRDHRQLKKLFMAEIDEPEQANSAQVIIRAQRGEMVNDIQSSDQFIQLKQGYRYEGHTQQADYQIIQFDNYRLRLRNVTNLNSESGATVSTPLLIRQFSQPKMAAELHWRVAVPLMTILLALLAIPLSNVRPRQGRYARLLLGIIIYMLYVNLLLFGRSEIAGGNLSRWLGLWWVHAGVLLLCLSLYFKPKLSYWYYQWIIKHHD